MRLHYLRSASLRALAGPYTHSVAPSDRPPTSLRPPTSPYQTCSPSLLHPCRVVAPRVPNPTTATLRNFISYASLIIRRSFTRFHASPPSFPFFPPSYRRRPSLFPNLSRETKNSIFFSFLGRKEILIRRMCKIEREREREGGNYISSRTINNEFKFRIIERAEMISHS